ncbi:Zn(2)-C6 fungal-type domain-containing protein [Mycena venus]|uniref:Zn(2)-C6 fungal-type domain-containing protein n=1 Tax=Mycena venus TaxID=2733690 RepID=A0A8H6XYX0_9AGAR|nr:Zn(2)-C6 fungal-type domain-containing protein [Mycena venus]
MPVDNSKPPKINGRRPQETVSADHISQSGPVASLITRARELEVKRSRGEVSCAECRRLKIKCDKQNPCRSCVRRGCSALCPNGALATGQSTRFVVAATEHLHRKIARRGKRIRMLEDALTALHVRKGGVVDAVHPLLIDGENLLNAEDGAPGRTSESWEVLGAAHNGTSLNTNPKVDAFGTLSISDHDISTFFGPTGRCESLLISNLPGTPRTQSASMSASPSSLSLSVSHSSQSLPPPSTHASGPDPSAVLALQNTSFPHRTPHSTCSTYGPCNLVSPSDPHAALFSAFPLTPIGSPQAIHALVTPHLPPRAHARTLVQSYFSHIAWLFRGVTRGQVGDMMRVVYAAYGSHHNSTSPDGAAGDELDEEPGDGEDDDHTGPHGLALLFTVFAAGALVQPPTSPGGEDEAYRQHVATEAEHLHQIARAALALQPVLEKPSVATIQVLHLMSIYTSLTSPPGRAQHGTGREDTETSMEMTWGLSTLAAHLSQTVGLHRDSARWGMSATMVQRRRLLFWDIFVADVWTSLSTGRPPSFSPAYVDCSFPKDGTCAFPSLSVYRRRVADVTARILPPVVPSYATVMELDRKVREFRLPPLDDTAPDNVGASLQRCVLDHVRETVLMYLHLSFFAQAIIEQPVNPLKEHICTLFANMPIVCARFWMMWTFAFSAAVVFGTVVTRGPRSPLAAAAMAELEQACVLFSEAAVYSRRATKALPILKKLSKKARLALAAVQNDPSGGNISELGGLPTKVKKEEPDGELSIFAKHTRSVPGQIERGQEPSLTVSAQQPPREHYQQQQQRPQGQIPQESPLPRQRQDSMPSSSFPTLDEMGLPTPKLSVNVNMSWDSQESPQSAHDYSLPLSVMDERIQRAHQQQFYTPDRSRMLHSVPPPPSVLYAWPVDSFGVEAEPRPQNSYKQQQQQQQKQQRQQGLDTELAQLGLAARDSESPLEEMWGTFLQDSGLLEGTDFHVPGTIGHSLLCKSWPH